MLNEFIKGKPKPQPRVRACVRGGHAAIYTPETAGEWRRNIEASLSRHRDKQLSGAFEVNMEFYFNRPKSHYGTGKNSGTLKDSAPRYMTTKPDIDNLAKLVLDCLNRIKYWNDDAQVVTMKVSKSYADIFDQGVRIETRVL